jgi:hypothetical protein
MCEIDYGESCEVWRETRHTARKRHSCDCCGAAISVGEKYLQHYSVFEGDPTNEKMCGACADIREQFQKEHGAIMGGPGYFEELLADCIDDGPKSERKWTPMLEAIQARRATAAK